MAGDGPAWLTVGVLSPDSDAGRDGVAAILADPDRALLAFDYDGTLAPIVDEPLQAHPHPEVISALTELSRRVGQVAIVTGRPAEVVVELAGLEKVSGLEQLVVVGHYGMERWDAASGELVTEQPPEGLQRVREALPELLDSLGAGRANIEDKGLSLAVHVRRLPSPAQVFAAVEDPLRELADEHGLVAEPGRFVVELRAPGMDKGLALRRLVEETQSASVTFTGDDLGDLAAFAEVRRMRTVGVPGLLVCSGSDEVTELAEEADLVVDGPAGVADFVRQVLTALAG